MTTTFHGLDLLTAPGRVFTPRPATEALVDAALARIDDRPATVADVGTGTGAIAVTIAVAAPEVEVWATDTSAAAVELARANARRHGVDSRVHVLHGNLLEPVPDAVDVVVANLPYLPESERRPEYDAEPDEAIYAPGDGLGPLRTLVALCADGKLAMPGWVLVQYHRDVLEAYCVDGLRTAFGRAGPKGIFWRTRADDMAVKVVRELLRRNPRVPPERIGDVAFAATAQVGDQGLTLGRDVALLAGIPQTVPGFAVDRMCAGALTAVTAGAGEIPLGAAHVVLAGGVEHMGHHPMAEEVEFNPRFVAERLVDPSAVTMGATAENLHDRFPHLTKEDADAYAVESQRRAAAAWADGVIRETVVPMSVFTDDGWRVADRDEFLRPDTTMEGLARLETPFRPGGRVTAGNSAGLTDGATACLLASGEAVEELGLEPRMRLVAFAFVGVEPELMGIGPIPATWRVLEQAGLTLGQVGLFELNEPFAVQVLTWCDALGVDSEDERLNPYGGAIACGHPLAATGVRLMAQLAYGFRERPEVRYGLTALCIGMGMGAAVLWERA